MDKPSPQEFAKQGLNYYEPKKYFTITNSNEYIRAVEYRPVQKYTINKSGKYTIYWDWEKTGVSL